MKKRQLPREKRKVHRKGMSGICSNTLLFSSVLTEFLQKYFNFLNLEGKSKRKPGPVQKKPPGYFYGEIDVFLFLLSVCNFFRNLQALRKINNPKNGPG